MGEFEAHYLQEVERLMKLTIGSKGAGPSNTQNNDFSPSGSETAVAGGTTAESRWEVSSNLKISHFHGVIKQSVSMYKWYFPPVMYKKY